MPLAKDLKPHENLVGQELKGGWRVVRKLEPEKCATGGFFSCGYLVEGNKGKRGFLKALDFYSGLRNSSDPAKDLEPLIKAFNFERDLLDQCKDRRLSRIVTALEDGVVSPTEGTAIPVQYIIFELAEGDIRPLLGSAKFSAAWALRVLHQAALGLEQLHSIEAAHQDLKPSNVLQFNASKSHKLADLGRAAWKGKQPPHHEYRVAGDESYAPPELLWGDCSALTWEQRRMGCDLYHLGSLISSLFTTIALTPLITMSVEDSLGWRRWQGSYKDALVFLYPAFEDVVEYIGAEMPKSIRDELMSALRWLSDPDPQRRGHPNSRSSRDSSLSLRRFVSIFDRMAKRAELELTRS